MMNRMNRKYTADEMRSAAFGFEADPDNCLVAVGPEVRPEDHPATIFRSYDIAAMLRQAADMMDCISKEIERIDSMPSAPLDGVPYHQEINGHRLKARIEFFDSVKKIIRNEKKEVKQ